MITLARVLPSGHQVHFYAVHLHANRDVLAAGTQPLAGLQGYDTSLHIEQMHDWNFWAGIGGRSYSFTPQKQEGIRPQLTRLSPNETGAHFGE